MEELIFSLENETLLTGRNKLTDKKHDIVKEVMLQKDLTYEHGIIEEHIIQSKNISQFWYKPYTSQAQLLVTFFPIQITSFSYTYHKFTVTYKIN